ncbi:MAG TPA: SRPBCC family protein [Candidatus Dormibacteraeota bacterium]|nr:SRPBCC family protein [Candidatus Dormibacteraeota bacterium]
MILDNDFQVGLAPEQLWPLLRDLEMIAPCLPGGAITERLDPDTYRGTITIKVGPVTVSYAGTATVLEVSPEAGRMVMRCEGRETRGPGSASALITIEIRSEGGGSAGHIQSDVAVTGRVAQFGRGMMAEVGDRLLTQFARCVESTMRETAAGSTEKPIEKQDGEPGPSPARPQAEVRVLRMLLSIAWDRLRFWRRR